MSLSPGQILGHYRIIAKLGEGGMGEVFEAQDQVLGRSIALKTLTKESATKPSRLERFRTEAKAVAALNHPNIVHIYSVEEVDEIHFLTMEKVDGKPLDRTIPKDGMEIEQFFAMATELVSAVAAAHNQGVTHRDLKPANLLVNKEGRLKVLDFGLAKIVPRAETIGSDEQRTVMMTREGSVIGSAPYMSPEQARGETVDFRTDIFSLGTVLYQALTGISPFHRKSSVESQFAVIRADPKPLASLRGDLPENLIVIVDKAMAKDPGDRYRNTEDMLRELKQLNEEVRSATSVHAAQPGAAKLPATAGPRAAVTATGASTRGLVLWSVAVALAIAVGAFAWNQLATPAASASDQTSLAVIPFENLTGSPGDDYLGRGVAVHLITQLSELSGLRVVGRSEAWENKEGGRSRQELARRLGVGLFLDGAVQRDGEYLNVSVHLSDIDTNTTVWGETFRRSEKDLMQLQSDISDRVTAFLEVPVSRSEQRRLARRGTESFRAYDFYLQGQDHLANRPLKHGPELALSAFQQAIRQDAEFALAHVGLSEALWRRYRDTREDRFLDQAEQEAQTALDLDPQSASAQVAIARVLRERGDVGRSIAELQQSVSSHPNPDQAYIELGHSYLSIGENEMAEEWFRAAVNYGPNNWWNWNSLGFFLSGVGKYDEAAAEFEQARTVAPVDRRSFVSTNLVAMKILQGNYAEAAKMFEGQASAIGNAGLASNLGTAYFFVGRLDRVEPFYQRAIQLAPNNPTHQGNIGDLYTALGRASDARSSYLQAIKLSQQRAELTDEMAGWIAVGVYQAKASACSSALDTLAKTTPLDATTGHMLAVGYALCGSTSQAVHAVAAAIDLGFPPAHIRQEPEFAKLIGNSEFDRLTS